MMKGTWFIYNSNKITSYLWLYFFIIVFVNIALKIICLDYSSLWFDEVVSVECAWLDFGHIKHVSEWDNNPPFYYYLLSVWVKIFNDSEFCVRLLSVIFSSLAGGVTFLFANKFFNKTTAILSSLLFISSNFLFYYSHEARAYSLVLVLVLLSSYMFLNFTLKNKWIHVFLLGFINFLIVYTHYISAIVILFQILMALIYFDKKNIIKISSSYVITLLLIIFRFTNKQYLLIFSFKNPENKFWLEKSNFSMLIEVLRDFFLNNYLIFPFFILIVLGVLVALKNKEIKLNVIYSLFIGIGSIIFLFIIRKKISIFLDRYLIFSIPFIFILIAFDLSTLKTSKYFYFIFFTIAFIFIIKINFTTLKPMDYKNMVNFIKYFKTKNDLIIVKQSAIPILFGYYYEKDFLKNKKKTLPDTTNVILCNSFINPNININNFNRIIILDVFNDNELNNKNFLINLSKYKKKQSDYTFYKGINISFYQ